MHTLAPSCLELLLKNNHHPMTTCGERERERASCNLGAQSPPLAAGKDSPESARALISALHTRWVKRAVRGGRLLYHNIDPISIYHLRVVWCCLFLMFWVKGGLLIGVLVLSRPFDPKIVLSRALETTP